MGLGGEPQSYYIHPVNIRVRGVTIPVEAGFLPVSGLTSTVSWDNRDSLKGSSSALTVLRSRFSYNKEVYD